MKTINILIGVRASNLKTSFSRSITAVFLTTVFAACASAQVLVHDYQFQGNLNDSVGNVALTSLGGTVGSGSYTFGVDQGLVFSGESTLSDSYSIALRYSFSSLLRFDKVVDYKARTSGNGFYNLNGSLAFYPIQTGVTTYLPNQSIDVVLTRTSAGVFKAYLNGALELSFTDSSSVSAANIVSGHSIFYFFDDDFATTQREASAGVVTELRIFDGALPASSIATALTPPVVAPPLGAVPEPSTYGLAGAALLGIMALYRRNRN